jgi:hypothetical protein
MTTSLRIRSGISRRTASSAALPSAAWRTEYPSRASSSAMSSRVSSMSSTTSTLPPDRGSDTTLVAGRDNSGSSAVTADLSGR